jgi:hypothetical protein
MSAVQSKRKLAVLDLDAFYGLHMPQSHPGRTPEESHQPREVDVKSVRFLIAAAPVAALVLCQTVSVAHQPTLPSTSRSALSDFLNQSIERGDVPGVVAAVVNRDTVL